MRTMQEIAAVLYPHLEPPASAPAPVAVITPFTREDSPAPSKTAAAAAEDPEYQVLRNPRGGPPRTLVGSLFDAFPEFEKIMDARTNEALEENARDTLAVMENERRFRRGEVS